MGMRGFPRGVLCERARSWAALAPDGELSELERKLLGSHLERCPSCADFSVEVAAIAVELRAAALERIPQPVAIPSWRRRRPAYGRMRTAGAAAAVAAMALGVTARAPLSNGEQQAFQVPRVVDFSGGDENEIQQLRNLRSEALASARAFRNRPARLFGNQPA
jgi:predicted anti-sigma-YlaC factor YlaD